MACLTVCTQQAITTATGNCQRGGVTAAFITSYDSIDWAAMALPANFTEATDLLLSFVMQGAGVFVPFSPERKTLGNVATFAADTAAWTIALNGTVNGLTNANRLAVKNLQCCDLVAVLFTEDCQAILVGAEYKDDAWFKPLDPLRLNSVTMNTSLSGGTDKASLAIGFQAVQYNAPYFIADTLTLSIFTNTFT